MEMERIVNKSRKKISIGRPLTNNEKVLLTILATIILYYLLFKFVFGPQNAKINTLEEEGYNYDMQIAEHNRILRNEEKIGAEWTQLHNEKETIVAKYFPILDQSQIIYLLNELILDRNVDISDFIFSSPEIDLIEDREIAKMDVELPFEGEYEDIISLIQVIDQSSKMIIFNSLNFDQTDTKLLSGNMNLQVLSLEGIVNTDNDLIHIETNNINIKDPFAPFDDYIEPIEDSEKRSNTEATDPVNLPLDYKEESWNNESE